MEKPDGITDGEFCNRWPRSLKTISATWLPATTEAPENIGVMETPDWADYPEASGLPPSTRDLSVELRVFIYYHVTLA